MSVVYLTLINSHYYFSGGEDSNPVTSVVFAVTIFFGACMIVQRVTSSLNNEKEEHELSDECKLIVSVFK